MTPTIKISEDLRKELAKRKVFKEGKYIELFELQKIFKTKKDKKIIEDIEFARKTEEAWKRYEKGEFKSMNFDEFIEMLKKL